MSRAIAREVAMKLVYCNLVGGTDTPDAVLEKSEIHEPLDEEDKRYTQLVLDGVTTALAVIDEKISRYAVGWSIERIARVDLAILRVAIYEMLFMDDIPLGASINEAVELAKTFGGERSYAFINGILGTVADELGQ